MTKAVLAVAGFGLGAGVMYLADPDQGRRRRARLGDATRHAAHLVKRAAGMTSRDVQHRLSGLAARMLDQLIEEPPPIDDVLAARVRARLGRLVSHPGAIEVAVRDGVVTLSGPIFETEVEQLVKGVEAVAGVTEVENRLQPHREATHVPALQGPGPRKIARVPSSWARWSPTARLVAGAAGLALLALSSANRPVRGAATGIAGVELLERALLGTRG
ncbi:MAG: BON domain-containing protein [Acidobacteria bacterium]|nr:BON domain-containing protein [Acidobacteriota bacterium]